MKKLKKAIFLGIVVFAGLGICSEKRDGFISKSVMDSFQSTNIYKTAILDKGQSLDECVYSVDKDGVLTIGCNEHNNSMKDYSYDNLPKWYKDYSGFIKEVVILDGITNISNYAFYGCSNLEKVYIPKSVKSISKDAFITCKDLKICASDNSYAKEFAINNNISFLRTVDMNVKYTNLNLFLDETTQIECEYDKEDVGKDEKLMFSCNNTNIAFVDYKGTIIPKKEGKCIVTASIGGSSISANVNVSKYNLNEADIKIVGDDYVYDSTKKIPKVQIIKDDKVLKKGIDYSVRCSDNVEAGKGLVIIEPMNKFCGTVEKKFTILPAKMDIDSIESTSKSSIKLAWNKKGMVSCVDVYRSENENYGYKKVFSSSNNEIKSFEDNDLSSDKEYFYKVRGTVKDKDELINGEFSNVVSIKPTLPKTQISNIANATSDQIRINWDIVDDAKGYIIYRKENKFDQKYKEIAKVSDKDTFYVDKDVKESITYRYSVVAYDDEQKGEVDTTGVLACVVDDTSIKDAKCENGSIKVEWSKAKNVDGYYLYRKVENEKSFSKVIKVDKDSTSYKDKNVLDETTYTYAIAPFVRHGMFVTLGNVDNDVKEVKTPAWPSYTVEMSKDSDVDCCLVGVTFTNESKKYIRIYSEDAALGDKTEPDFNRRLNLVDTSVYEDDDKFDEIEYVDVAPGSKVNLLFTVDGITTYYGNNSDIYFKFDYNDKMYVNKSNLKNGTTYFEDKKEE